MVILEAYHRLHLHSNGDIARVGLCDVIMEVRTLLEKLGDSKQGTCSRRVGLSLL